MKSLNLVKVVYVFLVVFLLCVMVSCHQRGKLGDGQPSSVNWSDSSFKRLQQLRYFYNNNLHDSLYRQVPLDMAFHMKCEQWECYYYTWWILVNDLTFSGHADEALEEVNRMHEDATKRDNSYGIAVAEDAMGLAYAFQSNYIEAAKCYQQALKAYPQDADMTLLNSIFMDYSTALRHLKDYQTMDSVQQQWKVFLNTKAAVIPQHDKSALYANWHFKHHAARFDYYFCLENYAQAAAELDSAQHYQLLSGGSKLGNLRILGNRTKLYLAQKEYEQALAACDELVEKNKEAKEFSYELRQLDLRWEILEGLGRYEDALAVHKRYKLLSDSVNKANNAEQLNELNKRFEIDELKAEQERTTLREIIMVSSLILLGLIIIIFFRHRAAKRLEQKNQELIIANARAEESLKMKTNFIQQISHEIRTPLNILSGFAQIVTTPNMELDEEARQNVNHQILENTDRITGLVNKMLELSDANSRTIIELKDDVSAMQIASEAVTATGIESAGHLSFEVLPETGIENVMLHTNQGAAVRALSLILDNARKFTAPAEAYGHEVSVEQKQRASLRLHANGNAVQFIVEDTGIGVPAEEAEHIFDEFVQLDEYYDGTGIGLTVARSIARRLGGDIILDTSYTDGARFVMSLPLS